MTETQQPSVNVFPNGGYGYGNGGGAFGDNGAWWIIILFLFAMMGGWGNNRGDNGGYSPSFIPMGGYGPVQQGFDQASIMGGINGLQSSVSAGFANAEVSRCNGMANILQALNNNQASTNAAMNSLAMGLQNCCCENRSSIADLKYTVATENCADRAAVSDGIRDVITSGTSNTQKILDKLCQLEMDGIKQNYENRIAGMQNQIDTLRTQLQDAYGDEKRTALGSRILADNLAQTQALEQYLNPAPIPAYVVQNPNCCQNVCGR